MPDVTDMVMKLFTLVFLCHGYIKKCKHNNLQGPVFSAPGVGRSHHVDLLGPRRTAAGPASSRDPSVRTCRGRIGLEEPGPAHLPSVRHILQYTGWADGFVWTLQDSHICSVT